MPMPLKCAVILQFSVHLMYFIFQIRLPTAISDEVEEDPTGVKALWDRGWLGGSSQKVIIYLMCERMHVNYIRLLLVK